MIWGNSLANETRLVYRTGFNLRGFVREVPLAECPEPVQETAPAVVDEIAVSTGQCSDQTSDSAPGDDEQPRPQMQLRLF